jgi:hypothetical protein
MLLLSKESSTKTFCRNKVEAMKLVKIALALSVGLYVVCVGLLAVLRAMDFNQKLSTSEMLYGPVITIASCWIIFGIVYALSGRKKREKN